MPARREVLQNVGVMRASCVVITFANPRGRAAHLARGARLARRRAGARAHAGRLPARGAAVGGRDRGRAGDLRGEPHALVASVAAAESAGVTRRPHDQRHTQPPLRDAAPVFPARNARKYPTTDRAFRENIAQRHPAAARLGRRQAHRGSRAAAAPRRRSAPCAATASSAANPRPDTVFKEGDVVVVYGTPEAVEHAETLLLMG